MLGEAADLMDELYSKTTELRNLLPTKTIEVVINDVCINIKVNDKDIFFDYFKDFGRATAVVAGIIEGIRMVRQ